MVVLCRVQGCSGFLELVHEDVSARRHAHRDVQRLNVHFRFYGHVGLHGAFPIPREGFHCVEGSLRLGLRRGSLGLSHLVRFGLRESHGGERHQNNGQHKTKGFHVSFSLRNSFLPDLGSGLFAGSVTCDQSASTNPSSYTVIANYNTTPDVKQFLIFIARRNPHRTKRSLAQAGNFTQWEFGPTRLAKDLIPVSPSSSLRGS